MTDDGATDHLVHMHAGEPEAIDETLQRSGQHLQI